MEITAATAIGVLIALVGTGGVLFTALRYNRTEAAGYIEIMKGLNESMEQSLKRAQEERDEMSEKVLELSAANAQLGRTSIELQLQIDVLRRECDRLTALLAVYEQRAGL